MKGQQRVMPGCKCSVRIWANVSGGKYLFMFLFDGTYCRFRTKVGLSVDNRKCTKNCFTSNEQVANYLAGLKAKRTSLPGDPFQIGKLSS